MPNRSRNTEAVTEEIVQVTGQINSLLDELAATMAAFSTIVVASDNGGLSTEEPVG